MPVTSSQPRHLLESASTKPVPVSEIFMNPAEASMEEALLPLYNSRTNSQLPHQLIKTRAPVNQMILKHFQRDNHTKRNNHRNEALMRRDRWAY